MFLNLCNGELTVNTYRLPQAEATTLDDLYEAFSTERDECLTASIENELKIYEEAPGVTIAVYTGLTGAGEFVYQEEAHNISGANKEEITRAALCVWGADEVDTKISFKE